MNSSATTNTTTTTTTQHGKPRDAESRNIMDIHTTRSNNAESSAQPDVMEPPVDFPKPMNNTHKHSDDAEKSTQLPAVSDLSQSSFSQIGEAEAEMPPLISQQAHVLSRPHPTQYLLSLYDLLPLAASVERINLLTGEKTNNKLRRSYEGQVKTFGLAGRNKAVKHEGTTGGFAEMLAWPEEEWQNQRVGSNNLLSGLPAHIEAKLEKAMKFEPGPVPRNDEWENILGHEKLKAPLPTVEPKLKQPAQLPPKQGKSSGNVNGLIVGTPGADEAVRPKRTGKKRRYDEHSFEGYGEGFVDDEGDAVDGGGYSSGEGSRKSGASKKKRKKDYNSISPSMIPDRGGSYGVGMMHMGNGIGAYNR